MHEDREQVATLGDLLYQIRTNVGFAARDADASRTVGSLRIVMAIQAIDNARGLLDMLHLNLSELGLLDHPAGQPAKSRLGRLDETRQVAHDLWDDRRTGICGDGSKPLVDFETDRDPGDEHNYEKE